MPTSEPLTTGETARSLQRIELGVNEVRAETAKNMTEIREKLDKRPTWTDIERLDKARDERVAAVKTELLAKIEGNREDIDKLSGTQTWLFRLVIAANIAAVLALVLGGPLPS